MSYQPVEVVSRADQVMKILMDLIANEKLSAGDFLPSEAELCRQLGVSRSTLREVLRRLEARGLITTRHGVGIQVVDHTRQVAVDQIKLMLSRSGVGPQDMLEVRLMLECQGAALAAQRATAEDIERIAAAIAALTGPTMTIDANIQADLEFHVGVAEASKNVLLIALIHTMRGLLLDTITLTFALNPLVEPRREAHAAVLEAIQQGDPQAADAAMRSHLCKTEELFKRHTVETASERDAAAQQ